MSNLPQPYDRYTTTTTLLDQSNTIVIDALPELFEGQLLLRPAALAPLKVANWIWQIRGCYSAAARLTLRVSTLPIYQTRSKGLLFGLRPLPNTL